MIKKELNFFRYRRLAQDASARVIYIYFYISYTRIKIDYELRIILLFITNYIY